MEQRKRDSGFELVVPPVFSFCTKVLDAKEQIEARDMYWERRCSQKRKAPPSAGREMHGDGGGYFPLDEDLDTRLLDQLMINTSKACKQVLCQWEKKDIEK
ncbi:hypothetical protein Bca52824_024941 [Brassica carinata]|uniref:Uncharacterized protein n=1 Tax=Brassica carinata TaxID=52824 RepID=A0A8X7VLG6_BRACI|nr:hypothetical protein Bca52824_024941 [Brassica carinata]